MAETYQWFTHKPLLEATQDLRITISHAHFGKIFSYKGNNCLPVNRLYLCKEDCGYITWLDKNNVNHNLMLETNSIVFMPSNIDLCFHFTSGQMIALHYNIEIFPGIEALSQINSCRQLKNSHKAIGRMFKKMKAKPTLASVLNIQSELLQIASEFCPYDVDTLRYQASLKKDYTDLLNYISMNLDATLTIDKIIDHFQVSRDYLSKKFRRDMKVSLKAYLSRRLIHKASGLLMSKMKVKDVSNKLSFSSEFYFSRFFKKHTGIVPSQFYSQFLT